MKVKGIKALCSATKNLVPVGYAPRYKLQVHIDTETGELFWADIVGNGYIQYNNPARVFVCDIEHPATMAEIKEMLEDRKYRCDAMANIEI